MLICCTSLCGIVETLHAGNPTQLNKQIASIGASVSVSMLCCAETQMGLHFYPTWKLAGAED